MIAIVAVLVMLVVGLAALGLLIVSGILLVKLAPVILVVWLATRVIRGNRQSTGYRIAAPREHHYSAPARYSPDDAWLDTRG